LPLSTRSPALLKLARNGDQEALGRLLEDYRDYLRLLARSRVGRDLRVRLDPSDLVQETLLEAQRDFRQFLGASDAELGVWLRRILVRNLADHGTTVRRNGFNREQPPSALSGCRPRHRSRAFDAWPRGAVDDHGENERWRNCRPTTARS
jgi:DNA-directed RNA polymerase specialized sigma24 family protein